MNSERQKVWSNLPEEGKTKKLATTVDASEFLPNSVVKESIGLFFNNPLKLALNKLMHLPNCIREMLVRFKKPIIGPFLTLNNNAWWIE